MPWFAILLVGAAVGFLGGAMGKGGAAVATPVLAALGVPPVAALASPLPAGLPGTWVAWSRFARAGSTDRAVVVRSIAWGLPAVVLGALASAWIDGSALVEVSKVLLVAIGLRLVVGRHGTGAGATSTTTHVAVAPARVAVVAAVVGLVSGLLANAGGALLAPLYLTALHLPVRKALGSSLAVASVLAIPATAIHAALGHVDWTVAAVFALSSVPLSSLGARCALRLDPARLERAYGLVLVVLSIGLLAFAR